MRVFVAAALLAATLPATATAAELTPDGPATLLNNYKGASTAEGRPPEVLTAVRVVVGEGGNGGTVRIRAGYAGAPAITAIGDPVELPATPGTYTFGAPHIRWDYRGGRIGLDQTVGGHALVDQRVCDPTLGQYGDPCRTYLLDIFAGDPPPGAAGTPSETRGGASLTMTGVYETDRDEDLRGDQTEDRTDLQVSTAPTRDPDGRLRVAVTVRNAGPLSADLPALSSTVPGGRWLDGCLPGPVIFPLIPASCRLAPLAVGASRTLVLVSDVPDATSAAITANAEGPDLVPADNAGAVTLAAAPAFVVVSAKQQSLRKGIRVQVQGVRAGRSRVTAAFTVRGRTIRIARTLKLTPYTTRSVTLRPQGAKLRSLRRAVARGPLTAAITVRTFSGKTPVSVKTVVR